MSIQKVAIYVAIFLCCACNSGKEEKTVMILPESSVLEKIMIRGTLDISTFYNTTDYYVYRGITRGFHYDLAQDFAEYLGVKLRIIEVNNNIDTAIHRLQEGFFDLLAVSLTPTPERKERLSFSQPFFKTDEVLVRHKESAPIQNLSELDGKEIFISKSASSYKKVLQQIQDSLNIHIYITEIEHYSYEELIHLVETGEIDYTVIDENIAQASSYSMNNIDYSFKLKGDIAVSWATKPEAKLLTAEIDAWLKQIRKSGKLNYLYNRYFRNRPLVPHHTSKYALIKKGDISVFDQLLKKESQKLNWDWRLLAALVYTESQFNPETESEVGAYGLMQVIPETADQFKVTDYFQPDSNVYVGVEYLKYLDKYFSVFPIDSTERVKFILASYNAGAGHVLDAIRLAQKYGKNPNVWDNNVDFYILHKNKPEYYRDPVAKNGYCNGVQTYKYVQSVLDTYNNYKNIKQ